MSEYQFGLHWGHLNNKADRIAKRHGAVYLRYREPNGNRRGWFAAANRGAPFDQALAELVLADIEAAGGFDALRRK